ncbi:MAG: hypothetical protein A3C35_00020 [Omnitrophica bacterium RIFCSPHIGHO2_02_FULL_46_11]|nr:MAG: hypothetical protein A3C35_00020 [Omnitrophica bacterium RIFCSPHIGHO2_02_FULL_46_11]OGW86464.1 MAG: hypothetical protein A3A81_02745 [Omnitrophica bacterium RIFCSPLOWO2_01_FULL_45_10b]
MFHFALWRFRRPKHQATVLFLVFFLPLTMAIPICCVLCPSISPGDLAAIALLHFATSCAYILVYPAAQADNPSLRLLTLVKKSAPHGMEESEILDFFKKSGLFEARIYDLLNAGLIYQSKGRLCLTRRGRSFVLPFIVLRKVLGMPAGEG